VSLRYSVMGSTGWGYWLAVDFTSHSARPEAVASSAYKSPKDAQAVADWLNDRDAGYPMRELPWPTPWGMGTSDEEGATWPHRNVAGWPWDLIVGVEP
jgi:hypothetical protein